MTPELLRERVREHSAARAELELIKGRITTLQEQLEPLREAHALADEAHTDALARVHLGEATASEADDRRRAREAAADEMRGAARAVDMLAPRLRAAVERADATRRAAAHVGAALAGPLLVANRERVERLTRELADAVWHGVRLEVWTRRGEGGPLSGTSLGRTIGDVPTLLRERDIVIGEGIISPDPSRFSMMTLSELAQLAENGK